jgi:hypothetical protein
MKLLKKRKFSLFLMVLLLTVSLHAEIKIEHGEGVSEDKIASGFTVDPSQTYIAIFELKCEKMGTYAALTFKAGGKTFEYSPMHYNVWYRKTIKFKTPANIKDNKVYFGSIHTTSYKVRNLRLIKLQDMASELVLPRDKEWPFFNPGETAKIEIKIKNNSNSPAKSRITCTVINIMEPDKILKNLKAYNMTLKQGEEKIYDFGSFKGDTGLYEIIISGENKQQYMTHRIAFDEANKRWDKAEKDRLFFGMHAPHFASWYYKTNKEKIKALSLMNQVGVGILRMGVFWKENSKGQYDQETLPQALKLINKHGIELLAQFTIKTPKQYASKPLIPKEDELKNRVPWFSYAKLLNHAKENRVKPTDMNAFRKFTTHLANMLNKAGVRYIEAGNEVDWYGYWFSSCEDYCEVYQAIYEEFKHINPDFFIMNAGLTMSRMIDEKFLEKILETQASRLDAVAIHSYSRANSAMTGKGERGRATGAGVGVRQRDDTTLFDAMAIMKEQGVKKPIWVTEGDSRAITEYGYAAELAKKFIAYKVHGVQCYIKHHLKGDGQLYSKDGNQIYLSAIAYSNMVRRLRGKKVRKIDLPEGFEGAKFDDTTVLWLKTSSATEKKPFSYMEKDEIEVYNFIGQKVDITTKKNTFMLIGREPVYIVEKQSK